MARERLSSRLGFILLSAGCAIGLGNVWRFPYITGRYGGAAFVLMYLLFLVFMGVPVMIMEFAIGRAGRANIVGALKKLEPAGSKWHGVGFVSVAGNYLLLMYYSTITGWLLYYFGSFLSGTLNSTYDTAAVGEYFSSLTAAPGLQIAMMGLALLLTAGIVIIGLKNGVEKITKVMMLILFILMFV
ncbi:MAG: sodium-dependent transporter, partial [Spirochaetes bacterium]|nr:sodium-dependent transporter [Candidatus Ornithospirochaeta stercoravium]